MKIKFLSPVSHDADKFEVGDTADLPNAAVKALLACGAAEMFDAAAAKAAAKAEAEAQALAAAEADAKAKAEQAAAELAAKAQG
jgi:hypothetical protein